MTLRDMNRKIMDLQVTSASAAAGFLFLKDKDLRVGWDFDAYLRNELTLVALNDIFPARNLCCDNLENKLDLSVNSFIPSQGWARGMSGRVQIFNKIEAL